MNLSDAKKLYKSGALLILVGVKDPVMGGWMLRITTPRGDSGFLLTALANTKIYISLDTLLSDVERITGISQTTVIFPS